MNHCSAVVESLVLEVIPVLPSDHTSLGVDFVDLSNNLIVNGYCHHPLVAINLVATQPTSLFIEFVEGIASLAWFVLF